MTTLKEAKKWNQPYETPDPEALSAYQRDIYGSFTKPIFSTKPSEWEQLAKEKVPEANFGYVFGSASSFKTYKANLDAFDKYRLRPRMLVNATRRDVGVDLFGTAYRSPILVAPIGVQNIMHHDAEEATARACKNVQVPMILSTAATRSIEQVAAANGDGDRWYQLYWPKPQEEAITVSLLNRAKTNGYKVLVVTLDTFALAWRPEDLDNSYLPFLWGDGCQIGHSDPVFQERYEEMLKEDTRSAGEKLSELWNLIKRPGNPFTAMQLLANASHIRKSRAWLDVLNSGTYRQWEHLKLLKELWDGPIVLKGIQTVEDAHKAIEYGMDGIIVSNHGGRQVDGAIASLDALAEIGADDKVKQSGLTILFDSGIRTGADVLKAIALGAKAVLVARPYMYGLAIRGQAGVEHVLKCIMADTDNMLGNMGKRSLKDLGRDDLQFTGDSKL
ncbi:hypothetical protein AC578_7680 [Pseudocercospora eumusae]|uniref:FMN hydroxy acid dehydrogenase domain-containing protein n=1 Tax=Pseudocercospora eumusae TaxID=321146 RepID=A0A139GUW7_9PEZI|nr:hypothetical protein AC578_7680 [Pseudocercospora eumusae]